MIIGFRIDTVKNAVEAPYHGMSLMFNHELVLMHVYPHFSRFRFCFQDVQLLWFQLLFISSFPADLSVPHVVTEGLAQWSINHH